MLENHNVLQLAENNNLFLVDWLTVTFHRCSPEYIKWLIGLDSSDIPWLETEKFRNGYPVHYTWNGITISFGADEARFYKDPSKARSDMGVCLNMSGTGCRSFESYGHGDWLRLFRFIFLDPTVIDPADPRIFFSANITRLDIAYDDHIGILDIHRMELDVRDRYYKSKSTYSERTLSDDQKLDIHGTTLYFGSKSSPVMIRIYDKAAERGIQDKHWIRVELQLRDERAKVFAAMILRDKHVGLVASGVLRNYLCFLTPTGDSNKSRWPLADYWDRLLLDMQKISLWVTPGEEYNFAKTEHWLVSQGGQALRVIDLIYGRDYLLDLVKRLYPHDDDLSPKYRSVLESHRLLHPEPVVSVWDSKAAQLGYVEQLQIISDQDPDCPW